jgi:hypothetical protein
MALIICHEEFFIFAIRNNKSFKMKIKTAIISFLLVILIASNAKPVTWISVSYGYWDNPSVWSGGVVPPYSSSDTFLIRHPVAFNYNLFFSTNAYVQIDSTGGLCGHYNITLNPGATLNKYGILEADSLFIPGGHVYCYAPGNVVLTLYGIISNGGSFESNGCSVIVGDWFVCQQPIYAFMLDIPKVEVRNFKLSPNPTTGTINIELQQEKLQQSYTIEIYNMQGRLVLQKQFREQKTQLDISSFAKGIYLVRLSNNDKTEMIKVVKE